MAHTAGEAIIRAQGVGEGRPLEGPLCRESRSSVVRGMTVSLPEEWA